MSLRARITDSLISAGNLIPKHKRSQSNPFYFNDYRDNLIRPMDPVHEQKYKEGRGKELEQTDSSPAKMASVASSSAMTFNLLGNDLVVFKSNPWFQDGQYTIEYEKQMFTLNRRSSPANLDAFLANDTARHGIFCEMKMLEWLGAPGTLKNTYLERDYYIDKAAYPVFRDLAEVLKKTEGVRKDGSHVSIFKRYDAWQMFKHTLAIYNYTSSTAKEIVDKKTAARSMAEEFEGITLANIVFEMDSDKIKNARDRKLYLDALVCEQTEAHQFIQIMLDSKYGLLDLFRQNCKVSFDIEYIDVRSFIEHMDKTDAELNLLAKHGYM